MDKIQYITPEFLIAAIEVAELKDGRKIIHALMSQHTVSELSICLANKLSYSKKDFDDIGLSGFIGKFEDVIIRFKELEGYKVIGIDPATGDEIKVPHIMSHYWMPELHGAKAYYFVVDSHVGYKAKIKANKEIKLEDIKKKVKYLKIKCWLDKLISVQELEMEEI